MYRRWKTYRLTMLMTTAALVLSIASQESKAQDVNVDKDTIHDFKKAVLGIRKKFEQATRMHIAMNVLVFESASSAVPFYNETVEVFKDEQNYLCHMGSQDILMNAQYIIMANRISKEMTVNRRNLKGEHEFFKDPVQLTMDSLFSFYGEPRWIGKEGQVEHFKQSLKGDVQYIDLFVDASAGVFQKVEYRYKDNQFASIDFKAFEFNPTLPPGLFEEQNYITIVKNVITPSKNFHGYKILNAEAESRTSK